MYIWKIHCTVDLTQTRKTVQHLRLYYWSKLHIHILTRRDHILLWRKGPLRTNRCSSVHYLWKNVRIQICENAICSTLSHASAHSANQLNQIDRIVQTSLICQSHTHTHSAWDYFTSDAVTFLDFSQSVCVCLLFECKPLILTMAGGGCICRTRFLTFNFQTLQHAWMSVSFF